jgi:hypothetical protein
VRFTRVPVLRVRLIAIGLPVALACAVPCAWLVAADDVVDGGPTAARAHGPAATERAASAAPEVGLSAPEPPTSTGAGAPAPARREPWVSPEVDALCRDLLPLDRLTAQAALAARFDATTDPRARALLHQVDQRLGLDAWARHRGQATPTPDLAPQPTTVVSSLDPQEVQARAHRARKRRLQGAPR